MAFTSKSGFVRLLIWSNVTIIIFALVLLTHSANLLQENDDHVRIKSSSGGHFGPDPSSLHSDLRDNKNVQARGKEQIAAEELSFDARPAIVERQNIDTEEGMPFPSRLQKFSDSLIQKAFKSSATDCASRRLAGRRSLRDSPKQQKTSDSGNIPVDVQETAAPTWRTSTAISKDEPAFHVDYSGPKTHPPRNN